VKGLQKRQRLGIASSNMISQLTEDSYIPLDLSRPLTVSSFAEDFAKLQRRRGTSIAQGSQTALA
jgi:hypothetical protein